jgi:DNA invertase Pin-like site-specific DNA recombinase
MPTVAYLRISTGGPSPDSQRLAILDYAHCHGLTVQTFVEAHASARHHGARQGVATLLEQLHPGDLLLVSELARLGRSVGQIIQLMDRLLKQQVRLVAIKEHLHLNGTQDLQTKVMITLLGRFAEIERDLIAERTKEGLAAAHVGPSGPPGSWAGKPRGKPWWPKQSRKRRSPKFWASPARPCMPLSSPDTWPEGGSGRGGPRRAARGRQHAPCGVVAHPLKGDAACRWR